MKGKNVELKNIYKKKLSFFPRISLVVPSVYFYFMSIQRTVIIISIHDTVIQLVARNHDVLAIHISLTSIDTNYQVILNYSKNK